MPLVGHGLGILGLEEPPDVLPVLEVVLRAQVEVKAKLEVLEELAPARASGNELTPGGSELTGRGGGAAFERTGIIRARSCAVPWRI